MPAHTPATADPISDPLVCPRCDAPLTDRLLRASHVAARLKLSESGFLRLRQTGKFPPPDIVVPSSADGGDPIQRGQRWRTSTVERWIAAQQRGEG